MFAHHALHRRRVSFTVLPVAFALACAWTVRADEVAPAILPIVVEKTPTARDKDAAKLAALRARVVKELVAERPDLVDLAEGEAPVIGRPAQGIETLVSTYEGLATHLVAFESRGKGARLTLTVSIVVVDSRDILAKIRVRPFGADRRSAESKIRGLVLQALPSKASTPSAPSAVAEPAALPVAPVASEPAVSAADDRSTGLPPATAAIPSTTPALGGGVEGESDDGGAVWIYVTGGVTGALALLSVTALVSGAAVGVWALVDSNAYVADPARADLKDSSLLKGNVADALFVVGGLAALAAGGALALGLMVGFADDE